MDTSHRPFTPTEWNKNLRGQKWDPKKTATRLDPWEILWYGLSLKEVKPKKNKQKKKKKRKTSLYFTKDVNNNFILKIPLKIDPNICYEKLKFGFNSPPVFKTFLFKFQKIVLNMRILIFMGWGLQLVKIFKPIRLLLCNDSFCVHLHHYLNYI